jgi:hypothetical protein
MSTKKKLRRRKEDSNPDSFQRGQGVEFTFMTLSTAKTRQASIMWVP